MLEIKYRLLRELVPYAKNSRTHDDDSVVKLCGLLLQFGWTNPLLIADGGVIAGHLRLTAALRLAHQGAAIPRNPDPWQAPAIDLSHLTQEQRAAYVLADNRSALDAGWDEEILAEEMGWLHEAGFDLGLTGFEDDEIKALLDGVLPGDGPDPEDIPEVPVHPVSEIGDVWLCGRHRLVVGDCLDDQVVTRAMNGVTPHLLVTDPPYQHPKTKKPVGRRKQLPVLTPQDWTAVFLSFPGDVAYVWHAATNPSPCQRHLEDAGFQILAQTVWAMPSGSSQGGHYRRQHETCFYAVRGGQPEHWVGGRSQSTLWSIEKELRTITGQTVEKPVDCMLKPIQNNSSEGQAVYDPFLGAGTTLMACELSGRSCIAIELDPGMADVSVRRWMNFTKGTVTHEATGQTFDEMAQERPFADLTTD